MERAAAACVEWISRQGLHQSTFRIFCGKGNNGGDGLAIGRMLLEQQYSCIFYILESGKAGSPDFQVNLQRLHDLPHSDIHFLQNKESFPPIQPGEVVIDALFGSGLNKPLEGLAADLVSHLNTVEAIKISIDLPSGLFCDQSSRGFPILAADYTLTFQCYKTAFFLAENAPFTGQVLVLNIGLHPAFLENFVPKQIFVVDALVKKIYQPRKPFAHKGNFGHALLVAGSLGKMGAALLAARACLRSGVGLLTCHVPGCGYTIMQTAVPEAMVLTDQEQSMVSTLPSEAEKYHVIGIGPGIGTAETTRTLISFLVRRYTRPLVIDADGLNGIAMQPELIRQLPANSILTPHPKEFERLFGEQSNDFMRLETARRKSMELNIIIVLKGKYTLIASPDGNCYFNSTGNAGLAKGGTGDVLTGVITALVAQGYPPLSAAILGVYLHGLAGDFAAHEKSKEAMTAGDVIEHLPDAFLQFVQK
jgi:hydroxyethylthiazole kinase-like uncharacterized protein yjeF